MKIFTFWKYDHGEELLYSTNTIHYLTEYKTIKIYTDKHDLCSYCNMYDKMKIESIYTSKKCNKRC